MKSEVQLQPATPPRSSRPQLPPATPARQGWQGGLIRMKKAGLNWMDKIGFFQTNFEKIHLYSN